MATKDWRTEIEGDALTDEELRAGITAVFLKDVPEMTQGEFGQIMSFDVQVGKVNRKLLAGKRLARRLAKFDSLQGLALKIKRVGRDFDTDYEVEEIGSKK